MRKYDFKTANGINISKLETIVQLTSNVMDKVIASETEGLLAKPTSANEIVEFNVSVNEIVKNKLRNRLGV